MSDPKVKILIEAVNSAKGVIQAAEKDLKNLDNQGKANNATFQNVKATWGQAAVVLTALTGAALAAKGAFDFGKQGAQLDYQIGKFDRLALSAGTYSDVLMRDLREATRGMYSDAQLMGSAGDFMALGLAKTHDEAVRLASVAGALDMNMNQLVLTLTNQTTMRFDALGVMVDGFQDKVDRLKELGHSDEEAFRIAFLEQAEEQIERVGHAADTTLGSFQRLEAQGSTSWDRFRVNFAKATAPIADALADVLEHTNNVDRAQEMLGARWVQSTRDQQGAINTIYELNGAYIDQVELLQRANLQVEIGKERYNAFGKAVEDAGGRFRGQSADMQRWLSLAQQFADVDPAPAAAAGATLGEAFARQFSDRVSQVSGVGKTLNDLQLGLAGGFELQEQIDFASGLKLTPEEAKDIWGALFTEATLLEERVGNISMTEAKSRIESELGVPFDAAKQSTDDILANLNALAGKAVDAEAVVKLSVVGDTWIAELIGGGRGSLFSVNGGQATDAGTYLSKDDPTRRAGGGWLDPEGTLVGEQGPEYIRKGWVFTAAQTRSMLKNVIPGNRRAGGGRLLDGHAGVGAVRSGAYNTYVPPSPVLFNGVNPFWGDLRKQPDPVGPASTWPNNAQGGAGGNAAALAAGQAAVAAAASAAIGVGSAVASQAQETSEAAIREFTQQSVSASRNLQSSVDVMANLIANLPTKVDLKNAVLEAMSEAQ